MIYQAETLQVKELENGIAEISFCSPHSVNKLDLNTLNSLNEALDALQTHQGLKGVVLTTDKDSFIVGADITEFLGLFAKPEAELNTWLVFANSIFNKLEDLPVPTLSALRGFTLGGGCECVLATDFRIGEKPPASVCQKPNSVLCLALVARFACQESSAPTARWKSSLKVKPVKLTKH